VQLETAGVSLDSPQDVEEYVVEQWLIKFNGVKQLTGETEKPKQAFLEHFTTRPDVGGSVRKEVPRQIEGDTGGQDQNRPDIRYMEADEAPGQSKLARLYQRHYHKQQSEGLKRVISQQQPMSREKFDRQYKIANPNRARNPRQED
jgi:hypothetical protein